MARWAAGLTLPTASTAEAEQLPLTLNERITAEGKNIDSTLPFIYGVNQAPELDAPKENLPAWRDQEEFIKKVDGSRLLIVKAPAGSGKTTTFPAFVTRVLKGFGRICCTQVRRVTTQVVCTDTQKMWRIREASKVVGFQHGLEKSSQSDQDQTRVLFLTEDIIMRQAMSTRIPLSAS